MEHVKETANIQLLFVEDNRGYLETLLERMELFGYRHIATAQSAAKAQTLLNERHFDIIVADMRMERDDSGFAVLDAVRNGNLSSIVIILTANETVTDCREALKARGAWDYIPKAIANTSGIEELHKSIQAALTYFNRWGNFKDETWIREHYDELRSQYAGKWVAVFNNAVIESADSRAEIEQRVQDRRLPFLLTIIKQIDAPVSAELSAELTVFVEGPTDVHYITKALSLFGRGDILERIILKTTGDKSGQEGSGKKNLAQAFTFLKNNPKLHCNNVLFLFDQDVKDEELPNKGRDFENLYVRRMGDYSAQIKGSEFLFPAELFEEAFNRNFVQKDLGRATKDHPQPQSTYVVKEKMALCEWICEQRDNRPADFQKFHKIIDLIDFILTS